MELLLVNHLLKNLDGIFQQYSRSVQIHAGIFFFAGLQTPSDMDGVCCRMFDIPPYSPDINLIESTFHLVRRQLSSDAIEQKIPKET